MPVWPKLSLSPGCGICDKQEKLTRCSSCKMMFYCSREHQAEDRDEHKYNCNAVKQIALAKDQDERMLRNFPAGVGGVPVVVGGVPLDHGMEMLRLCRSDNVGVRGLIQTMMLQLGKDQECYDFIKWWAVTAKDLQYDFRDLNLPYLDIKNAEVFEPMLALMLLKIKLLLDLTAVNFSAATVGARVPQEILDQIEGFVPRSPIIAERRELVNGDWQKHQIRTLKTQIDELYWEIHRINKWMWFALRVPEHFYDDLPRDFSPGSMQKMKNTLSWSFNSWLMVPRGTRVYSCKD
ncbi:hypothetical protein BDW42DRAFT_188309 [Aspergillus taichungensis]|uniref:MYND-type domain-containing protein n=1 Tax=Aspergillus taichungensis TaxID=482145 RepID=A0A2J5HIX2_9EURO|nr:hypothetical protein BDW42DRAFT_188309 [Aspergillus taichungensis]